jgi:hypothetical protein
MRKTHIKKNRTESNVSIRNTRKDLQSQLILGQAAKSRPQSSQEGPHQHGAGAARLRGDPVCAGGDAR